MRSFAICYAFAALATLGYGNELEGRQFVDCPNECYDCPECCDTLTTSVTCSYTTYCPVTTTCTTGGVTYCTTETEVDCITTVVPTYVYALKPANTRYIAVTQTALVTVTTACPVTKTYTEKDETYCITTTETDTMVTGVPVTCIQSLPGKTVIAEVTREVEVTLTSYYAVTRTSIGPGTTLCETDTVTSTYVTYVPYTNVQTLPGPTAVIEVTKVAAVTVTSLCPVIKTVTEAGTTYCLTEEITSTYVTYKPTTYTNYVEGPDVTHMATNQVYTTYTSYCPHTEVKTLQGNTVTITFDVTQVVTAMVPSAVHKTVTMPDITSTHIEYDCVTVTTVCPVTSTVTEAGQKVVVTNYETQELVETVERTVVETITGAGCTETDYLVETMTSTCVSEVTQTHELPGSVVTEVIKTTSFCPPTTMAPPTPETSVPVAAAPVNAVSAGAFMAAVVAAFALF